MSAPRTPSEAAAALPPLTDRQVAQVVALLRLAQQRRPAAEAEKDGGDDQ